MGRSKIPSSDARRRPPALIDELVRHPDQTVEVGRQRKREVVVLSASRFDEIILVTDLARDLAWAEFARGWFEDPTRAHLLGGIPEPWPLKLLIDQRLARCPRLLAARIHQAQVDWSRQ